MCAYDFGDDWEHVVVHEDESADESLTYPRCMAGARRCPPEDCGDRLHSASSCRPSRIRAILSTTRHFSGLEACATLTRSIRMRLSSTIRVSDGRRRSRDSQLTAYSSTFRDTCHSPSGCRRLRRSGPARVRVGARSPPAPKRRNWCGKCRRWMCRRSRVVLVFSNQHVNGHVSSTRERARRTNRIRHVIVIQRHGCAWQKTTHSPP